ncbi:MAG: hypothetical protein AAB692_04515, partial [Patescibacteria group bacterium]
FVRDLIGLGFSITASGGTAETLAKAGVPVANLSDKIGPPLFGHRWATLDGPVYKPILSRDLPEDDAKLSSLGLERIDLVCVDLYPLEKILADPNLTEAQKFEFIDVGGPTLLRAAAKGPRPRIVVSSPEQRAEVIAWLKAGRPDEAAFVRKLANRARYEALRHDLLALEYFGDGEYAGMVGRKKLDLEYGENPYQKPAALYITDPDRYLGLNGLQVVAGKVSHNNITDIDRLLATFTHIRRGMKLNGLSGATAVIVKHGNACGAAVRDDYISAILSSLKGDDRAAFGGWFMTDKQIGKEEALALRGFRARNAGENMKLDGVIAPSFTVEAVAILRKGVVSMWNLVALPQLGSEDAGSAADIDASPRFRRVRGGFLKQPNYTYVLDLNDPELEIVCGGPLTPRQRHELVLAYAICATSNSNSVTMVEVEWTPYTRHCFSFRRIMR